jgi:hypothetical protein
MPSVDRPLRPSHREALADAAPEEGDPVLSVRVADEGVKAALIADPEVYSSPDRSECMGAGRRGQERQRWLPAVAPARPSDRVTLIDDSADGAA